MRELTDQEWQLLQQRRDQPGWFFAVRTTRIFCRPGCPARTPLRHNVRACADPAAALRAGYRPCKKCRPLGTDEMGAAVARLIGAIADDPGAAWPMARLATAAGLSPLRLRQACAARLSLAPLELRNAIRLQIFKTGLKEGESVTDAGYRAGYSGPARRHAASAALGMTPRAYAAGGAGEEIHFAVRRTRLGDIVLGATARGICVLSFVDDGAPAAAVAAEFPKAVVTPAPSGAPVESWADAVATFLVSGGVRPDLPVDLRGTAFQLKVWQALRALGPGQTCSYGALAAEIGHPGASRAVGSANARNRVAIIVPCHLVLATGGKLGGYSGGLDRKKVLLALEGAALDV